MSNSRSRTALLCSCAVIALSHAGTAAATTAEEMIAELSAQVAALNARLEQLESTPARNTVPVTTYQAPATSQPQKPAVAWTDTIKINGDFRYRHDAFDVENSRDRHRQRMRARVSILGKVNETVSAGFGLATGSSDPLSSNQSFDDGASSKNVVIDQAFVKWQTPIDGLQVKAGKFKNTLHRAGGNGLLWDSDLRPEGLGATYENRNGVLFSNVLASWVDESSNDDDSFLLAGQFGTHIALGENSRLTTGAGYYNYLDARGEVPFFNGDGRGNQLNTDGEYVSGFELVEGFVEYVTQVNASNITLFADYVKNLAADDYDQGFALGAKLSVNDWQIGYTYQELEADAVPGTFSDSNFIGGGTDGEGHIVKVGYALSERIGLKGAFFLNDRNVNLGTEEEFKRLILDISFKY